MMKRYEDLDITDNFMFAKVFSHKDIAKDFLQDILKISIDEITVASEATAQEDPFHKSVRFDVLVKDDSPKGNRYFDIELQMENTGELPKRARYYQGMCDLDALAKGMDYDELGEQYILFICPDDIFGKGKSVYSFQNRDDSDPNILMGDLCHKNFYIFKKYSAIVDAPTREYMQYFATKKSGSEKIERIEKLVENYRQDPITKKAYMTLEQELNMRYKKGVKDGVVQGVKDGADAKNRELAKGFRDSGVSIEVIAEQTKLSKEEILAL